MSVPLKDFRPELRESTHRALKRIALARGVTMTELGRQILEDYVRKTLHEAKLILGQDADDPDALESTGEEPESKRSETGIDRSARR